MDEPTIRITIPDAPMINGRVKPDTAEEAMALVQPKMGKYWAIGLSKTSMMVFWRSPVVIRLKRKTRAIAMAQPSKSF
jgi:hypothetical protein